MRKKVVFMLPCVDDVCVYLDNKAFVVWSKVKDSFRIDQSKCMFLCWRVQLTFLCASGFVHACICVCSCIMYILMWYFCPISSGHPSCLDMSDELVCVIQTYHWQCMECKTCTVCQQPHHEDEMMFCDKCDRGYHTFCVGMDSIPTGGCMDLYGG